MASANLDVTSALRDYVSKMLKDIKGMKSLLLDKDTMGIVSTVYSQNEILQKEVFLVQLLDAEATESMMHLKAVVFVRPTNENVWLIKKHLKAPRHGEFHLFFSNMVKDTQLLAIAEADEQELVKQVQEYFADYLAMDSNHLTLNLPNNHVCMAPVKWDAHVFQPAMDRMLEGILSVLLSLKKQPIIRYQRSSENARRLATEVQRVAFEQESALFSFWKTNNPPILLIIDRNDDPVTPLLMQWTYQAMVHELLTIQNNRVDLRHLPKVHKDSQEVVLSASQDQFFKENMFENYGDLGANVKKMVDEFQSKAKSNQSIQTIADMQRFVESFPQFRKASGNVSKHVALITEMSRIVDDRALMAVSQMEQELACSSGLSSAYEGVAALIDNPKLSPADRVRLVMLFALRYEKEGSRQLEQLISRLVDVGTKSNLAQLVYTLLRHAGESRRTGDLYGSKTLTGVAKRLARGIKGVENVYTQHQPLLLQTVDNLLRGRLKEADYPFTGAKYSPTALYKDRPQDVIVFIVGGTTFEEARGIALLNSSNIGARVVLGGTVILNANEYLANWEAVQKLEREGTV
eukprot:jgi/Chlat1/1972/Chrsp158S02282